MEYKFKQSYIDPNNNITTYGTKMITVDRDFKYIIYYGEKIPLEFTHIIKFGNEKIPNNLAARQIEKHIMFKADIDDFIIVQIFNNDKMTFDRIDYLNIEFR